MKLFSILVVLLCGVSADAQWLDRDTQEVEADQPPVLALEMHLDETDLMCYEPVTGYMAIRNVSDEPIEIVNGPYPGRGTVRFLLSQKGCGTRTIRFSSDALVAAPPSRVKLGPGDAAYRPVFIMGDHQGPLLSYPGRFEFTCMIGFMVQYDDGNMDSAQVSTDPVRIDVELPGSGVEAYLESVMCPFKSSPAFLFSMNHQGYVDDVIGDYSRYGDYETSAATCVIYQCRSVGFERYPMSLPEEFDPESFMDGFRQSLDFVEPLIAEYRRGEALWGILRIGLEQVMDDGFAEDKDWYGPGDVLMTLH